MTTDTTNVTAGHFTGELMSVPGTGKAKERRRTRPASVTENISARTFLRDREVADRRMSRVPLHCGPTLGCLERFALVRKQLIDCLHYLGWHYAGHSMPYPIRWFETRHRSRRDREFSRQR